MCGCSDKTIDNVGQQKKMDGRTEPTLTGAAVLQTTTTQGSVVGSG